VFFEKAHYARCGVEAKRTATSQYYGVNRFDRVDGVKKVGLTGARRGSAYVDPGDRSFFTENHRTSSGSSGVGIMTNPDASDIHDREPVVRNHTDLD
jgi:hypothetical protein